MKFWPGTGAPVAHDGALQVLGLQGLPQQGVVQQVELAGGQIVGCPPPGVDELAAGSWVRGSFLDMRAGALAAAFAFALV